MDRLQSVLTQDRVVDRILEVFARRRTVGSGRCVTKPYKVVPQNARRDRLGIWSQQYLLPSENSLTYFVSLLYPQHRHWARQTSCFGEDFALEIKRLYFFSNAESSDRVLLNCAKVSSLRHALSLHEVLALR